MQMNPESTVENTTYTTCPSCQAAVKDTDRYCLNCGKALKTPIPSTTTPAQISLYLKSLFLAPIGIFWAIPYIKSADQKAKIIGWVAVAINVAMIIYVLSASSFILSQFSF